jgi:hypothetical protein
MKDALNPKAFYNVVVLKDGSEISSFSRAIHGSVMTVETFAPIGDCSSVKVLKSATCGRGKSVRTYRKLEIKISDVAGVKSNRK